MRNNAAVQAPAYVTAHTLTSALGAGNEATLTSLAGNRGGLQLHTLREGGTTWLGFVDDVDDGPVAGGLGEYDCKAARLIRRTAAQDGFMHAVSRARDRYGADRVGCFLGTIAAGLTHLEGCYEDHSPRTNDLGPDVRVDEVVNPFAMAEFCQQLLGISGPAATISTACSSSAKVFSTAHRYLQAGLCDAAVVAGVDVACGTIVYGFRSLGLLSPLPCRPWDRRRDGLSIGEAVGFALLERGQQSAGDIALLGYGESCDAYHMTSPHPEGVGAETAMQQALRSAGQRPEDIDYINLHGSGTPANDASEDAAVYRVFGNDVACSSTKGWTGHTQGAAGITEAILSFFSIRHGIIPATLNSGERDPQLRLRVALENVSRPVTRVLSNSFGFGGNNCALIFGAAQ